MIEITPLANENFGAVVSGVSTDRPLTAGDIETIKDALAEHTAVVINDLDEDAEWLLTLGRGFGPLQPHILDQYHHPVSSEMSIITANMGNQESRTTKKPAGAFWHSDQSYLATPSDAIMLYATHVPTDGGDTMVANTQLAYDALSDAMKKRIEGLVGIHRYGYRGGDAVTNLNEEQQKKTPDVEHPVVRTHPRSGKKILYVNPGFTMSIKGMPEDESDALLEELFEHELKPEFRYTHKWSTGQLAILDNRQSMHCAVAGYSEPMRKLRMIVGCTDAEILAA
ncbi:MAG: TauD/TfdA family dioxygenase [Rhodospirillales bacterium]|nr:TauD/TfdA family dioxygenase [Rhodospirillales bacterium]MBO6786986.1 TauD/TfdA family dioxygenase [Rhodospirillales bacterium]